jgi:hypothetical protein
MTNISPWYRWPIEIDGLPIKTGGSFHGKLLIWLADLQDGTMHWTPRYVWDAQDVVQWQWGCEMMMNRNDNIKNISI